MAGKDRRRTRASCVRRTAAAASVAAIAAMGSGVASASPWNQDPGTGLLINKVAYYEAEAEGRRFEQVTSEVYAERGLTPALMVGGKVGYAWQTVDQEVRPDVLSGLSEAEGYVQWAVRRTDRAAFSLAAVAAAPTSTTSRVRDGVSFDRDASAGASALIGYDLGPVFLAASAGPRFSLGRDADFLRAEATAGRPFGERGLLLVEGFATRSLGGEGPDGVAYDLYQVAPSIVLPVWRFSLQLGATVDVAGEGLDLGAGGFVALWSGR